MIALELRKKEEEEDNKDLKIKIMTQADAMLYDDDFDEEALYSHKKKEIKYKVDVIPPKRSQT